MRSGALLLISAATSVVAQENILGAYIFSRHGDRTAKAWPPTSLTTLGYQEIYESGLSFRDRYVSSGATHAIQNINPDIVRLSQISVSAPADTVLQNSAQAFLQGLYPAAGQQAASSVLRNGTVVQAPLNGYQLIPINDVSHGANSEDSAWLQGSSNCANAQISSNNYFVSEDYSSLLDQSKDLYQRIWPDVNSTFTLAQTNYMNAYTIWDFLNVASIHNASAQLPDTSDMFQLKLLANQHEFGLAFNESEPIRAVTGSIIAGEVLTALNSTMLAQNKPKLNIQFGAYAGMMSFFGLSQLIDVNSNFYGIPDYASTLVWELVTNSSGTTSPEDVFVRFLFNNGTSAPSSTLTEYPLFGSNQSPMRWNDFVTGMKKIAIIDQNDWCTACGNTTGVCSSIVSSTSESPSSQTTSNNHGLSKVVCGVIGAMTTLGVILGLQILVVFLTGLTLVKKSKSSRSNAAEIGTVEYSKSSI